MGYTHFWKQTKTDAIAWAVAIAKCNLVLERERGYLAGGDACSPLELTVADLCFNGIDDDGHETCLVENEGAEFTFCKTNRKPYDRVVTAVLAIMAQELGDAFTVTSDGDRSDWADGVALASNVLGEEVANPIA